jgi:indolepyruvate ferredoxin oxidoreductase
MAYKDEYEVARLYLLPSFRAQVKRDFGDAKIKYMLHPPFLRALGVRKKIALGRWFDPGFRLLRRLKVVRGTPFDVFGMSKVRRTERRLVVEYETLMRRAVQDLDNESLDRTVKLAALPDGIRGYEQIKLRNVEMFRRKVTELGFGST